MTGAFIAGIAVRGPGLGDWAAARPVLAGETRLTDTIVPLPPPALLGPNERRRAGGITRLALAVATEACTMSGVDPAALGTVFASANGDGMTLHSILTALADPDGQVSPTQFHNSVHNAAAGYWSIGTGARGAINCLAGHDFIVAAAMMKAVAETAAEHRPVLFCVYDLPMPEPLNAARPTGAGFGAALVLVPEPSDTTLAHIAIRYRADVADPAREVPRDPGLARLHRANPAARILRLLETVALGQSDHLTLALLDGCLDVTLTPCSTAPASSP